MDRLAGDGQHYRLGGVLNRLPVKCRHRSEVRDRKGVAAETTLELKCKSIRVLPPIGKKKQCPELNLTVIYAQEATTTSP